MVILSHYVISNLIIMNKIRGLGKRIITTVTLLCLVASLSSCSLMLDILIGILDSNLGDIGEIGGNEFSSYIEIEAPKENPLTYREEGKSGYNISLVDQKYQEGYEILPSTGDQKVLVIPVYFKDYTPSSCIDDPSKALENINKAFFGKSEETGWESISSYYYKSSYGKLNLSGMVTSWCPLNKTLEEVVTLSSYNDPTIWVLREAVNWFKNNYANEVFKYDQDKDGFIDSVCLVYPNEYYDKSYTQSYDRKYSSEITEAIESVLWAYTYWDYTEKGNVNNPVGNVYMWLSYDFLFDGGYTRQIKDGKVFTKENLVDTHTYVHEFGHVLGLEDYYSYDYYDTNPLGCLDMMDNNIGDHNSYTKYLLNWIDPVLIERPGTYTISTLTKDGVNALLIPADIEKFNYSPYSEYLMIELYSPIELNQKDSQERYMGSMSGVPYLFSKCGVKILHIDSRLVVANDLNSTYYYTMINNDIIDTPNDMQFIGANNTSSRSINPDYKLITLISSENGKNSFANEDYATNKDLFVKNDMLTEFTFNSGTSLNYNIEIVSIDTYNQTATISISNK